MDYGYSILEHVPEKSERSERSEKSEKVKSIPAPRIRTLFHIFIRIRGSPGGGFRKVMFSFRPTLQKPLVFLAFLVIFMEIHENHAKIIKSINKVKKVKEK